jgi:hypothetical protein
MNGEIIKSFLVGLGFGVDEASLSKFYQSISKASVRVTALYATIKVAAAGIFWSISKISEGFEQMGYEYRIIAPAINKALVLRRELLRAYEAAGINITKVVQQSVKFNMALAKTGFALKAIYQSTASKFFPLLTKQMDIFRLKIYANMPKIIAMLEKFVKFVFKAFEATVILGTRVWSILQRVYDFFYKLHQATDGWSTIILGAVAAWKLLNLAFLTTPLGMILAGLVGILALFDDFKTWEEGGASLFDWSSFVPVIKAVGDALGSLRKVFLSLVDIIGNLFVAFWQLFHGDWSGAWDSLKGSLQSVIDLMKNLWEYAGKAISAVGALGSWGAGALGFGDNAKANAAKLQQPSMGAPPLGVQNQANNTNMSVSQQTQITVQGSADANAVGKAVAGEQGRVNFDMTRNFKPAAR